MVVFIFLVIIVLSLPLFSANCLDQVSLFAFKLFFELLNFLVHSHDIVHGLGDLFELLERHQLSTLDFVRFWHASLAIHAYEGV